jgi:CubicO group peptidase (beta-lactamase class C family)
MKKFVCLFLLCAVFIGCLHAQLQDIVQTEGLKTDLQKANIGKIVFTDKSIAFTELKATDFLQTYKLTNKSNLFFTVFMANSFTNYAHRMAPDLPADSLVKMGNYQFSLYIDNRLIYQSNLLPGAPRSAIQNESTSISKPFIDNSNEGVYWTLSYWNRFLFFGGDSVFTDGRHLLVIEIRPYLKLKEIKTGELIARGELSLNVERNPTTDLGTIHLNKPKPYDGFPVSTETFDVNRVKELKARIESGAFKNIKSVVVIKNGKLLVEEYFNGENRDSLHDPRSVGKSFASTITGIAIKEGFLKNENQPLKDFYSLHTFDNFSDQKENITIRDLLTMSSAFDGNDDDGDSPGNEENMYPTDNWVKFALDLPLLKSYPATDWHYFTAGVVVLGDILNKQVKAGLEKYAAEKLFNPLHIFKYQWQYTPQHVPNTAGGIQMNALDFAKYGQLYKNNGRWNGQQLIPREWINKTFTRQKQIPGRDNEYYGYLFWNKTFTVKGKSYEAFYCAGNGGNSIFIFKDFPLVVVVTASAYGQFYAHRQVATMMNDYILPAVINK